jgi:hypothetical protein
MSVNKNKPQSQAEQKVDTHEAPVYAPDNTNNLVAKMCANSQ